MTIETLVKKAKSYLPGLNEKRLREAYDFAARCHEGQLRMDGGPYIEHPLAAALNLAELHVDEDTLVAALLHDVPEDTECTLEHIGAKFGKKISFLVNGVTKLSKVKYRDNMAERQVESLKKFFLHSAQDIRIILIKLADRLHNMETLGFVKPEKQLRIARETMEIYAPIANLLGLWGFKSRLEDLCFRFIYPKEFTTLELQTQKSASHRESILKETIRKLKRALKQASIEAEVESRPKNLYSIFIKMVRTGHTLEEMNDILGVRVIVKDRNACYQVLGIVHELFRPKATRIKDYISVPKPNGYQSLHTTVFGLEGMPTEFQIRTQAMHMESEYGIATHYFYKGSANLSGSERRELTKRSEWVHRILDLQKELKSGYDFMEKLKLDVFQDRIFVFTPQGDVVDLPQGANGIDFAYHIHTHLGDHATGLSLNGHECPLITPLKTGDTVEVLSDKKQRFPKREWLEKVKTNLARNKIRVSLKRESPSEWRESGADFIKKELHRYGVDHLPLTEAQKKSLLQRFELSHWNRFLEQFGNGTLLSEEVMLTLFSEEDILGKPHLSESDYKTPLEGLHYRQSNTRLIDDLSSQKSRTYYRVHLEMTCQDRVGLLRDMGICLANLGVNIYQIGVRAGDHVGEAIIDLILEVIDLGQLRLAFNAIESVDGYLWVHRLPDQTRGIRSSSVS